MKKCTLLLIASLAISAPAVRAAGIGWENTPFNSDPISGTPVPMYNSHGGLLDNSFSFELGTWNTGFTPTAANVATWAANWNVISSASAPATSGWASLDPSDPNVNDPIQNYQYFARQITFNANGSVVGGSGSIFHTNDQAYIWAFNNKTLDGTTEWALVTDASVGATPDDVWHVPDPSGTLNLPLTWNLSTADTAVYGSVNGVTGAGAQAVNPGAAYLQTFNVVSVVPEPGSALLLMLAGASVHLRRRRFHS